jgi:hypothetical protein
VRHRSDARRQSARRLPAGSDALGPTRRLIGELSSRGATEARLIAVPFLRHVRRL